MYAWHHHAPRVPGSIPIHKIIPGKTTVAESQLILGSDQKIHLCMESVLFKYIHSESILYGRDIEINIQYRGPNTGLRKNNFPDVYDGNSIVESIEIREYPYLNRNSDNTFEQIVAKALEFNVLE